MRNTFYFHHDYNSRNDERLLMLRAEYGAEAYGVFWMILETMAEASQSQINRVAIAGLSLGYGVPKERLTEIIDFCVRVGLFEESHSGAIFSKRMRSHMAFRESLSSAGRSGAKKRWSTSQKNRVANAKGKERKEEERKENIIDNTTVAVAPVAKAPHPGVQSIIDTAIECFGSLDDTKARNRQYAWLLLKKANMQVEPCLTLIRAAAKHDFWSGTKKIETLYRNAGKIAADLRKQSSDVVFIS